MLWNHKLLWIEVISALVSYRSDILSRVHGGSSEGWMGEEPLQVGCQRRQLGHPKLWETSVNPSEKIFSFGSRETEMLVFILRTLSSLSWASSLLKRKGQLFFWTLLLRSFGLLVLKVAILALVLTCVSSEGPFLGGALRLNGGQWTVNQGHYNDK